MQQSHRLCSRNDGRCVRIEISLLGHSAGQISDDEVCIDRLFGRRTGRDRADPLARQRHSVRCDGQRLCGFSPKAGHLRPGDEQSRRGVLLRRALHFASPLFRRLLRADGFGPRDDRRGQFDGIRPPQRGFEGLRVCPQGSRIGSGEGCDRRGREFCRRDRLWRQRGRGNLLLVRRQCSRCLL